MIIDGAFLLEDVLAFLPRFPNGPAPFLLSPDAVDEARSRFESFFLSGLELKAFLNRLPGDTPRFLLLWSPGTFKDPDVG